MGAYMKHQSIAIDGPAGAGKSTIAKEVAEKLSYIYVDTGAMYRAIGLYIKRLSIDFDDEEAVSYSCQNADITISYQDAEQQIYLNGENVTGFIRTEEAGKMAYKVSSYKAVRKKLVELQQAMAEKENVVMDGRDIGTKVLPEAKLKIYLTANTKERARRRYLELLNKNIECDINKIEQDIIERDFQDMNRKESPLLQADDAVMIDCSDMNADEVVSKIIDLLNASKNSL